MNRTSFPGRPTAAGGAALVLVLVAALSGCSSGGGSTSTPAAAGGSSAAGPVSATGLLSGTDAAASSGATASPGAGPTTSAGAGASSAAAACANLFSTGAVQDELTAVQQAYAHLTYIEPVPGDLYYGSCAGRFYAAVDFQAAPDAGAAEGVGLQDDGSAMQYFARTASGRWQHVGADGFPRDPRGCALIAAIPAALAALWHGCAQNHEVVTYLAGPGWDPRQFTYRPVSLVLSGDSTLGLTGMSWPSWTTSSALGTGTGWSDDCVPSCAGGTITRSAVMVSLTGSALVDGRRFFTRLVITWVAKVPTGLPKVFLWKDRVPGS